MRTKDLEGMGELRLFEKSYNGTCERGDFYEETKG